MSFLLKIAGRDYSSYIRLPHDDGFDPANAEYADPQFSGSPAFAEGAAYIADAIQNRDVSVPLILSATDSASLHQLIRDIEADLQPGAKVEMRLDGAEDSTFFDLERGRLEPQFEYYLARGGTLRAEMHLWVRPFGNTGTQRIVASVPAGSATPNAALLATHSIVSLPVTGILGDVEARGSLEVRVGSSVASGGRLVAYGFHRSASFSPLLGGFNFSAQPQASYQGTGASGAIASSYLAIPVSPTGASGLSLRLTIGVGALQTAHIGRHRVLMFARSGLDRPITIAAQDRFGAPLGPTAFASQTDITRWGVVDLGEINVEQLPDGRVPTQHIDLFAGGAPEAQIISSPAFHFNAAVLIPLDVAAGILRTDGYQFGESVAYDDNFNRLVAGGFFGALLDSSLRAEPGPGVWAKSGGALGVQGAAGKITAGSAFAGAFVVGGLATGAYFIGSGQLHNDLGAVIDFKLDGAPMSATVASGARIRLSAKQDAAGNHLFAYLDVGPSPAKITLMSGGATQAQVLLPASVASGIHGGKVHTMWLDAAGPTLAAYISTGFMDAAQKPAAPAVAAATDAFAFPGWPGLAMRSWASQVPSQLLWVNHFRAYDIAVATAPDAGPRQYFRFESYPESRVYQGNATAYVADRTADFRGEPPRIPACGSPGASGPARLVVLQGDPDNFVGTDLLDVSLTAVERFRYMR